MEPSLSQIEDYNGHESKEKKLIVNGVIAALFIVGLAYASVKVYFDTQPMNFYTPVMNIKG